MVRNLKSLVFEIAKPGFIFASLENGCVPILRRKEGVMDKMLRRSLILVTLFLVA